MQHNISLKPYNTFGIDVKATKFTIANTIEQLKQICTTQVPEDIFILSGGSNMLLTKDIDKTVIKLNLKGIEVIKKEDKFIWIKVQASEVWHDFVQYCISNNWAGIENLSLIPGHVGTSVIQNIGAYGVEVKDVIESCTALEISTLQSSNFTNQQCLFGYRESVFKQCLKNKYIITDVTFKLTCDLAHYEVKTQYGAIQQQLKNMQIKTPSIAQIATAVITIRQSKLPDPKELGNSGSFFKNPIISTKHLNQLKLQHPQIPHYIINEQQVKIPAGWLIEQSGFKGYRNGDAGVHKLQALVLVNYAHASGKQIEDLAIQIQAKIQRDFNIFIEPEVNIF